MTVDELLQLLQDLHNDMTELHDDAVRIAERLDDEKTRRDRLEARYLQAAERDLAIRYYAPQDVAVVRDTVTNGIVGYRVEVQQP